MPRHCRYCGRCNKCHIVRLCGHCGRCHCCSKRYYKTRVRSAARRSRTPALRRRTNVTQRPRRRPRRLTRNNRYTNAATQITSPHVLSPLYVKTGPPLAQNSRAEQKEYGQITPEMIVESLRQLTMWSQFVDLKVVMDYIKRHYPIKRHRNQAAELRKKLEVAKTAGIVCEGKSNHWRLQSSVEKLRHLPESVVNLFWRLYCDTMCALDRNLKFPEPEETEKNKSDNDTDSSPSEEIVEFAPAQPG